jgi:hypothetical protein
MTTTSRTTKTTARTSPSPSRRVAAELGGGIDALALQVALEARIRRVLAYVADHPEFRAKVDEAERLQTHD